MIFDDRSIHPSISFLCFLFLSNYCFYLEEEIREKGMGISNMQLCGHEAISRNNGLEMDSRSKNVCMCVSERVSDKGIKLAWVSREIPLLLLRAGGGLGPVGGGGS